MLYASASDVWLVYRVLLAQHNSSNIYIYNWIHSLVIAEDTEFASACEVLSVWLSCCTVSHVNGSQFPCQVRCFEVCEPTKGSVPSRSESCNQWLGAYGADSATLYLETRCRHCSCRLCCRCCCCCCYCCFVIAIFWYFLGLQYASTIKFSKHLETSFALKGDRDRSGGFQDISKGEVHNWSNAASNESRVALSGSTWPFLCKLGAHDRWGGQPCCGPIKETVPVAPMFSSLTIFYYISLSTSIAQVFLATLEYRLWREWPRSMVWPWFWGPSEFNQNKHGSYMWQSWRACFPIDIDISLYQVYIVVIKYIMITLFTLLLWSWKMIWSLRPCDAVGRISSIIQESS